MKKRCPEHGWFEGILSSDANMYLNAARFNRPGQLPLQFATEIRDGCPLDCGLCPDHQQHTCVGIIEVTQSCNLQCPTCFTDSPSTGSLTLSQVEGILDNFVKSEGDPEVVQFSGGEPSIHPKILDMIRAAKARNIKYVMLNTNGIRVSKDEEFVRELSELDVCVYLQFDGFKKSTHEILRGEDLRKIKRQALENLERFHVNTVLACTVQRGVNEDEYGAVVDLALTRQFIRGVVFQPTFYAGRAPKFDPLDRVTLPDVIKGIAVQSQFGFRDSDFFPIPCCYPNCSTALYVYMEDGKATPLTRVVNHEDYMDYFANKPLPDVEFFAKRLGLESLYSASSVPGSEKVLSNYCTVCGISLDLKELEKKVKLIMVQPFMDAWNFDLKRLMKCCVGELVPDGRVIPFCAYNNIYR